jgi:cellulose synthase/poly-beta-1,6-N-acetylglucosamine synthase-like glycosyltransferase
VALQQGLEAATGGVVVSLDADTRPRPGLARAMAALLVSRNAPMEKSSGGATASFPASRPAN